MRMSRKRLRIGLILLLASTVSGVALANPPNPTTATDLFVPAIPGLHADGEICFESTYCSFGTAPGQPSSGLLFEFRPQVPVADAAGNLYFPNTSRERSIGTCTIGSTSFPLQETTFYRVNPSGVV